MQSAHHWDALADEVAHDIAGALPAASPVAIKSTDAKSDFTLAFNDLLIARLLDQGHRVRVDGTAPVTITYKTQVVAHDGDGTGYSKPGLFTGAGAVAAGGAALADHWSAAAAAGSFLGLGLLFDAAAGAYTTQSNTEIIESLSIVNRGEIDFQKEYIFYINDSDWAEYGVPARLAEAEAAAAAPPVKLVDLAAAPHDVGARWAAADRDCAAQNGVAVLEAAPAHDASPDTRQFACRRSY
jgi:hypothetical protein